MQFTDVPLDAIITSLIFLIGVPALVLQSLAPELRSVVMKRRQQLLVTTGIPSVFAAFIVLAGLIIWRTSAQKADWVWIAVIASLFGIAVFTAMYIPNRYGRRDAIIKGLEREAVKGLYKKNWLNNNTLVDLIELGVYSTPGQNKELVLTTLYHLVDETCKNGKYRGDGLETLILGLVDILTSNPPPWNSENFRTAANILARVVTAFRRIEMLGLRPRLVDVQYAVSVLGTLGKSTLLLPRDDVSLHYVEALRAVSHRHLRTATIVSEALFETGIEAFEGKHMLAAMAAMDKLNSLAIEHAPARGELAADMLGLLAHFWTAGNAYRGYATKILISAHDGFGEDLVSSLKAARDHCARTTQFQTANKLSEMIQELGALSEYPFRSFFTSPPLPSRN